MPLYKIDEAIIQDESGKTNVVPIEQDNRFFLWVFEPALSNLQQKYELFDPRDPNLSWLYCNCLHLKKNTTVTSLISSNLLDECLS